MFQKIRLIFDIENWLWKYDFGTFWRTVIHVRIFLKNFPLSMLILGQKSSFLGPTIFKIPQPNWYYYIPIQPARAYYLPIDSATRARAAISCNGKLRAIRQQWMSSHKILSLSLQIWKLSWVALKKEGILTFRLNFEMSFWCLQINQKTN